MQSMDHSRLDYYDDEDLEEKIETALETIEPSELQSLVHCYAGVVDINRAVELVYPLLDDDFKRALGRYPQIDYWLLQNFINDLKTALCSKLGTTSILLPNGYEAGGFLYMIDNHGPIAKFANTDLFKRLYSVHQLGINRWYPVHNPHSRGEHSIQVTLFMINKFEAVMRNNPSRNVSELLLQDLVNEGVLDESLTNISEDDLIRLTTILLAAIGMCHDIFTPAGGDTIKFVTGIDEEIEVISRLGASSDFRRILEEINVNVSIEKVIAFIGRCVSGKSSGIIAQFIKSGGKDTFDSDRAAYTVHDGFSTNSLNLSLPECLIDPSSQNLFEQSLLSILDELDNTLSNPQVVAVISFAQTAPSNIVDVTQFWDMDSNGELICTNPERLLNAILYRAEMIAEHYAGFKMIGLEAELQKHLMNSQAIQASGILSPDNLLTIGDSEFFTQLADFAEANGDSELVDMLHRRNSFGLTTLFDGVIQETEPTVDYFHCKVKVKPGLDTKVRTQAGDITFKEWMELFPTNSLVQRLQRLLQTYHNKWLSIKVHETI